MRMRNGDRRYGIRVRKFTKRKRRNWNLRS